MKKIRRTSIFVLILCLWIAGNILVFRYFLAKTINLKTTYIAKRDIPPRSEIQTEDLTMIQVPEKYSHILGMKRQILLVNIHQFKG